MTARSTIHHLAPVVAAAAACLALLAGLSAARADQCTKMGVDVSCDDGRKGIFQGDAIL